MLTNNLELLEKLDDTYVAAFLQLIKAQGKKPMYLDFLAGLCSCKGVGVPHMQELVCDRIFGNRDGILGDDDHMMLGVTEHDSMVCSATCACVCCTRRVFLLRGLDTPCSHHAVLSVVCSFHRVLSTSFRSKPRAPTCWCAWEPWRTPPPSGTRCDPRMTQNKATAGARPVAARAQAATATTRG